MWKGAEVIKDLESDQLAVECDDGEVSDFLANACCRMAFKLNIACAQCRSISDLSFEFIPYLLRVEKRYISRVS